MDKFYIINRQGRQGDILAVRVDVLPADAVLIDDNVLARGEVTGHSHRIENARVFRSRNNQLLIQVDEEANLVHEEHGHLRLERGIYQVIRQREYDPIEDGRMVSD